MSIAVWAYRQVFTCCRRIDNFFFSPEKNETLYAVDNSDLPWLWLGYVRENGVVRELTNDVNRIIEYGTTVDPEWLEYIFNVKNVTWKYLDAKTLEEKEFPSEGFVIDDPLDKNSEDSADE
jgi:hypothetical protein